MLSRPLVASLLADLSCVSARVCPCSLPRRQFAGGLVVGSFLLAASWVLCVRRW